MSKITSWTAEELAEAKAVAADIRSLLDCFPSFDADEHPDLKPMAAAYHNIIDACDDIERAQKEDQS